MDQIYTMRSFLIKVYKENAFWILPILKFILGLIIFNLINRLGYASKINTIPVLLLMAILTAVFPTTLVYLLVILFVIAHIFYASIELSIIILLVSLIVLMLYIRVSPKKSLLIVGLLLCYYFKIPYFIPLAAGLFFDITSVIPICIGTFVWEFTPYLQEFIEIAPYEDFSLLSLPDTFSALYVSLVSAVTTNRSWLISALIFTLVLVIVNIISHLSFSYSRTVALCMGAITNLFGFMIAMMFADLNVNMIFVFVSTIVSLLFVLVVDFFSIALDYERAQNVEFEDEDNYYYVKVIPKIKE